MGECVPQVNYYDCSLVRTRLNNLKIKSKANFHVNV